VLLLGGGAYSEEGEPVACGDFDERVEEFLPYLLFWGAVEEVVDDFIAFLADNVRGVHDWERMLGRMEYWVRREGELRGKDEPHALMLMIMTAQINWNRRSVTIRQLPQPMMRWF
jgi:hypothetical protein